MSFEVVLKNAEIYQDGSFVKKDIGINGRLIAAISDNLSGNEVIDLRGEKILPGFIDTQVHFREPGLTHKEDIGTGSQAAALGGVTTFFEMPNTTPPTTTAESIKEKVDIAKETSYVNFAFFMGGTDNNLEELKKAKDLEGCCGIKIFLGSSTGSLLLYEKDALLDIYKNTDCMISHHSENEVMLTERKPMLEKALSAHMHAEWRNVDTALSSTKRLIEIAKEAGRKVHILHISTKDEMEFLAKNKAHCTVEVLPQHLTLYAPDCYDRLDTYAQMNPPIRTDEHRQGLWEGVLNGTVDLIGSDHAPHLKSEKSKGYPNTPSGMPGVQTIVPLMLKHVHDGKLTLDHLVRLMCENPAKLFKLNKGHIEVGRDADFTVVKTDSSWTVDHSKQASKCGWTPFHGMEMPTEITSTIVGGKVVMRNGELIEKNGAPAL